MYMNTLNSFLLHLQLHSIHILTKSFTTDSPKSHNPVKSVHFIQIVSIVLQLLLPIMLALCSMLLYYAQDYAGIIDSAYTFHKFTYPFSASFEKYIATGTCRSWPQGCTRAPYIYILLKYKINVIMIMYTVFICIEVQEFIIISYK